MNNIVPVDFIDVSRMAGALVLKYSVHFNDDTRRQEAPGSPHRDTKVIVLRGPEGGGSPENWQQDVPHADTQLLEEWPSARHVLEKIAASHTGRTQKPCFFGKAMVVALKPGGHVDWHVDEGPYAEAHMRFHICLVPSPFSFIYSGAMMAALPVGQLTFVDNRAKHAAINLGSVDRIHLIVDIRRPEGVQ